MKSLSITFNEKLGIHLVISVKFKIFTFNLIINSNKILDLMSVTYKEIINTVSSLLM